MLLPSSKLPNASHLRLGKGPTMAYKVYMICHPLTPITFTSMTLSPIAFPFVHCASVTPASCFCLHTPEMLSLEGVSSVWSALPPGSCLSSCSPSSGPHSNVTLLFKIPPPYLHSPTPTRLSSFLSLLYFYAWHLSPSDILYTVLIVNSMRTKTLVCFFILPLLYPQYLEQYLAQNR